MKSSVENLKLAAALAENNMTAEDFRACGFTAEAVLYPLSEAGFIWLCKFNNLPVDKAPKSWRFAPNAYMQNIINNHGIKDKGND